MIPIRDENPTHGTAWMTLALIAANVMVHLVIVFAGPATRSTILQEAAMIPARVSGAIQLHGLPPLLTLVTSQFLHGGWLHLGGNMLFLWIFGNNVEDEMGGVRFLGFYTLCGIIAGLVHLATQSTSTVPTIGASGAISGVMGAYAVMFPRARIVTLFILVFYVTFAAIPAILWIGIWLAIQLLSAAASAGQQGGGVAWFAHIGGLIAGLALALIFRRRRRGRRFGPYSTGWREV